MHSVLPNQQGGLAAVECGVSPLRGIHGNPPVGSEPSVAPGLAVLFGFTFVAMALATVLFRRTL
jgi:hypothetical protein